MSDYLAYGNDAKAKIGKQNILDAVSEYKINKNHMRDFALKLGNVIGGAHS